MIQSAFGWEMRHQSELHGPHDPYGDVRAERDRPFGDLDVRDVRLFEFAGRAPFCLVYTYDFRAAWIHEVDVLELCGPPVRRSELPRCLAGTNATPPENVGGIDGYRDLIASLRDPFGKPHEPTGIRPGEWDRR